MTEAAPGTPEPPIPFLDFLRGRIAAGGFTTDDTLASFLPLARQACAAHAAGCVAPLEGPGDLRAEGARLGFDDARRLPPRSNPDRLRALQAPPAAALDIVGEDRRATDVGAGAVRAVNLRLGRPGEPVDRPVYLPGYAAWEHAVGHHDPLTDVFSLGLVLAGLACGLDLSDPDDLEAFAENRRNLFALSRGLNPVVAQCIVRMTELDRHARAQDLPGIVRRLETYREQDVDLDTDLARVPGFRDKDPRGKRAVILARLQERLYEISRRNRLLYFRPTLGHLNLTEASVPLVFDVRNIRPEQILTWRPDLARALAEGAPLPLGPYLRFEDAPYLPGVLDRILSEARRDLAEYGFQQLRLVIAFLRWHNLKEAPGERIDSPLALVPVRLTKRKGVRDAYALQPLSREAEINPVLRHHLRELYGIRLPEAVELGETAMDDLHAHLAAQIRATEPGVSLQKVDRPQVRLVYERAKRRLDRYRRREALAGRGGRKRGALAYSYDPANFQPLGLRLFQETVRPSPARLRDVVEDTPRPRESFADDPAPAAPPGGGPASEKERAFAVFGPSGPPNPYAWELDLCSLTLGNFHYRKMSLVRDYEGLQERDASSPAFEAMFALAPRPVDAGPAALPPPEERFPVVPCDPTQAAAIARARTGAGYVIQGPPGTGKSQTITNLVADAVARGKRVLFVCEKRAAIDVVYHRLQQVGLGDVCCLIHDAQDDKKEFILDLKATYEAFLAELEAGAGGEAEAARSAGLEALRRELGPLERFEAALRAEPPHAGLPVRRLLLRAIALKPGAPALAPRDRERLPGYAEWLRNAEAAERLAGLVEDLGTGGVVARHPLGRLDPAVARWEQPIDRAAERLRAAADALAEAARGLQAAGLPETAWDTFEEALALAAYAGRVRFLAGRGLLAALDPASAAARRVADALRETGRRDDVLRRARERTRGWRDKLPPDELASALARARALETAFLPFLRPAWWRLRRLLLERYDFMAHGVPPTRLEALEALDREYAAAAEAAAAEREAREEFRLDGDLAAFARQLDDLRAACERLPGPVRDLHRRLMADAAAQGVVAALAEAGTALDLLREALDGFLRPGPDASLPRLREDLARAGAALDGLPDMLPVLSALAALPASMADALRDLPLNLRQLEAAMALKSVDEAGRADRDFGRFTAAVREGHLRRLESAHRGLLASTAKAVRARVRAAFAERVRVSSLPAAQLDAAQKAFKKRYSAGRRELEHEFGKTMRYRSIRELASGDAGEVIQDLKPVWLMSPLSVSDALPLEEGRFDLVVFDEASQIPLEDAIPCVFRAPQVIVVGDQMQLPPTNFFSARRAEGGWEEEDGAPEDGGASEAGDLDGNSFLAHAARVLPSTMLGWHYRSRHEPLIAFSNAAFYEARLLTVPEPAPAREGLGAIRAASAADGDANVARVLDRPVSFHFLEHGLYENRRNVAEAEYIAALVHGLLAAPGRPTLGVVAFSEAQQDAVEQALGRRAGQDAAFAARLEEEWEREEDGQFCGLLVKNLENIQGDERDVVVLSVCYGRGPDGRMLMNFGPINQGGGEKRLNVAFSRAKRHMVVVSSIRHADITNDYNDGARCLQGYLRYAEAVSGGDRGAARRALAEAGGRPAAEAGEADPAEAAARQIAEALRARGWEVDRRVGMSHFRCDLALRRAGEAAYCGAVLLDGEDGRAIDVLERDVMRPALLREFGWRVAPVLIKDWFHDPQGVVERIERAAGGEALSG